MLYQLEYVRCGRKKCWCGRLYRGKDTKRGKLRAAGKRVMPTTATHGHGPYWYGYWKVSTRRGVRLRKLYVGKESPRLHKGDTIVRHHIDRAKMMGHDLGPGPRAAKRNISKVGIHARRKPRS